MAQEWSNRDAMHIVIATTTIIRKHVKELLYILYSLTTGSTLPSDSRSFIGLSLTTTCTVDSFSLTMVLDFWVCRSLAKNQNNTNF